MPLQPPTDLAPEHMVLIHVTCRGDWGYGDVYPVCDLGDVLLEGEHDYGPGLTLIRITLWQGTARPEKARIRLQRAKGVLAIEVPSDLSDDQFHQEDAAPAQLEQGAREVVAALEAARARVAEEFPDFAVDTLLDRVRDTSRRLPATREDAAELIDAALLQVRTLRAAMARRGQAARQPQC